jgi:CRP-like cAMP-binding protein
MDFFVEFENVELWEVLRSSLWRDVSKHTALMREGESGKTLGILVAGEVEVSVAGKVICRLGVGEPVGEMSYLCQSNPLHSATVTTLTPCRFLEISPPALALASEELQERMRDALIGRVVHRLREANQRLAGLSSTATTHGEPHAGTGKAALELAP